MNRVADTSFLYAAFDAADARHSKALGEIAKPHALDIPLGVLVEFMGVVGHRQGDQVARQAWKDLQALANVSLAGVVSQEGAVKVWQDHRGLSLADAVGIQACLETGARLLSYDERQLAVLASLRKARRGAIPS